MTDRGASHEVAAISNAQPRIAAWGLALVLAGLCSPARAQSPDPTKGERPAQGVSASATYDGETVSDLSGGAKRGSTYHGSLQLQAAFDFERLFGWADTTGFLYGMGLHGGQPDDFVGGAQGVSSITGPRGARLDEAWLQHNFLGNRLSLLGGRYDLNGEFYRLHSAALFLNSSFGMGPELSQSGPAGPSVFPSTALATRVQYKATPELVLRTALLNGTPYNRAGENATTRNGNGVLIVSETAYLERPGNAEPRNRRLRTGRFSELTPYDDKYAIGLWHYTATFDDLSANPNATASSGQAVQHRGSSGGYLLVDRLLTRSSTPSGPRVAAFLQLGAGDARVNRFGSYVGAGLVASGLFPGPPNEVGIAVASARNGSHYIEQQEQLGTPAQRSETAVELSYLAQISKLVAVQPDLQYIVHPNTDPAIRNALAFLLRFEVSF
jgi:porin